MNIYNSLQFEPQENVAVKLSTGEAVGNYYISPDLIKDLVQSVNGTIVECNTAYGGSRSNTAMHRQVAENHRFTEIANVDILDENGSINLTVPIGRNIKATGLYFLFGIILTVLFQMYVPQEAFANLFGTNKGFGVLMAATLGVPVYVCGGGTIPLLNEWLHSGMSMGAGTAFMITGPATKITNLGALKIVLGMKHFIIYLVYVMVFALLSGLLIDLVGIFDFFC